MHATSFPHLVYFQLLGSVGRLRVQHVPELPVLVLVGLVGLPFGVELHMVEVSRSGVEVGGS